MTRSRWLALLGLALNTACGGDSAYLGQDPNVVWWTDYESGDLSSWGPPDAKIWTANDGVASVVTTPVRSGKYAMRTVSNSGDPNIISAAIGVREALTPKQTCYSAWYYLPALVTPNDVWVFFKFRSRTRVTDSSTSVDSWDVNVSSNGTNAVFGLFNHDTQAQVNSESATVPAARWFQLEACLLASSGVDGKLQVFLDGEQIFDIRDQPTAPSPWVEWNIGSIAKGTSPTSATVYVDDVAVSKQRLGPNYPVFWRHR